MRSEKAIVCSTDNNFFVPMLVMLWSLERSSNAGQQVFVIDGGLHAKNRGTIAELNKFCSRLEITLLEPKKEHCKVIQSAGMKNSAQIMRIFIAEILPKNVKYYIYIDSDIVINDNINNLFDTNIGNNIIGAVQDFKIGHISSFLGVDFYQEVGVPADAPYFNSGVLLVDRTKWDSEQLTTKLSESLVQFSGRHRFGDQDSLNAMLHGRWKMIHPKWNVQSAVYHGDVSEFLQYTTDEINEAMHAPSILHFTDVKKPWHMDCQNPKKDVFWNVLRSCPFVSDWRMLLFSARHIPMATDRWLRDVSRPLRHRIREYISCGQNLFRHS